MEKLELEISLKHLLSNGQDEKATRIIAQIILDLQNPHALLKHECQHISEHISSLVFYVII